MGFVCNREQLLALGFCWYWTEYLSTNFCTSWQWESFLEETDQQLQDKIVRKINITFQIENQYKNNKIEKKTKQLINQPTKKPKVILHGL